MLSVGAFLAGNLLIKHRVLCQAKLHTEHRPAQAMLHARRGGKVQHFLLAMYESNPHSKHTHFYSASMQLQVKAELGLQLQSLLYYHTVNK